jgi:tRNA A-37 threonylcarbamoyl transferase component Bud32
VFKADRLILPGPFGQTCLYENIECIDIERTGRFLILEDKLLGTKVKKVAISGLSRESAAALWTQLATKTRSAKIKNAVRDRLVNWQEPGLYLHRATIDQEPAKIVNSILSTSSPIELNFNERGRYSQVSGYLNTCGKVALRCWTAFWLIAGSFYAIALLDLGQQFSIIKIGKELGMKLIFLAILPLGLFVRAASEHLKSIWATSALILMTIGLLAFLARQKRKPNSAIVSEDGVVLLRKTPLGQTTLRRIDWSSMTEVKMLLPKGNSGKLRGGAIEIKTSGSKEKSAIKIPLAAFTSDEKRKQFLEMLNYFGRDIEIDKAVLETLAPRAEESYTSLWLSAIESAPNLVQLLPLADGEKLRHDLVIEKQFASGGQAVTYLASWSNEPGAKVILKEFLLPLFIEAARKKVTERFERDARLLKTLDHPQIVKLHDYFIEESRAFLVLEYIEGVSLREKVEHDGKLTESQTIDMARQMAAILDYLHSCTPPIVHRDFTPENLIVNTSGLIKLIDFDVALEANQLNGSNSTAGKTNYLPPEQFRGQACAQSDIYALGATMFFVITGKDPEPMQKSQAKTIVPETSDDLDQIIATCTEPELVKRYQSAAEILAELEMLNRSISDRVLT